ncbi:hypothetical protein MP228_009563 [Amoeboaphelidium protococcarum]|nr:hypothetical protein MP228_009563 [Amoeboaphelidium protococcarum]
MMKEPAIEFKQLFPKMEVPVYNYIQSYIQDVQGGKSGVTEDEFIDFIQPFVRDLEVSLDLGDGSLVEQFTEFTSKFYDQYDLKDKQVVEEKPQELDANLMDQLDQFNRSTQLTLLTAPKKKTDIAMLKGRERNVAEMTEAEKKKLLKAELKLQKKQESRNGYAQYQSYVDIKGDRTDYTRQNTAIDPELAKGKSRDIKLDNFDISFGGKQILESASVTFAFGRRYGLVGKNGVGKSTLLRFISRRQVQAASSRDGVPEYLRILHVEQEIEGTDQSIVDCVLEGDVYLTNLVRQEADLQERLKQATLVNDKLLTEQLSDQLKIVWTKMQAVEADKARSRASVILAGLGFTEDLQQRATKTFSGGKRMAIALARALFCKPDVLFLDEPSNHLDFPSVLWLESYLSEWPNTLVVVSHDRDLLDNVCTDIVHMHNHRVDQYKGNYTAFLGIRDERRKNQQREYESQLQYRQHLQDFIDRWRYNAKRAAQAQSKIKILEKLPELNPLEDDGIDEGELKLRWPDPSDKLSMPILQADNVSFTYDTARGDNQVNDNAAAEQQLKWILRNVNFSVNLDSRVALIGGNGQGKTSLLKLLMGHMEPTKGYVHRNGKLRIAYFAQHHIDALEADQNAMLASPVQFLHSKYPDQSEEQLRGLLGRFGITGATALQPMRTLSGGQKNRVVFALMAAQNPHILICDEITNNLDIATVGSLVKALNPKTGFKGGVLVVSHDARFVDAVCNEMWIVADGSVTKYHPTSTASIYDPDKIEGSSGIMEYKQKILDAINSKKQ